MENAAFLLEIGSEELPPRSLERLSRALAANLASALKGARLAFTGVTPFATPRRLAVLVTGLAAHQSPQEIEKRGPSVDAAFDGDGRPTRAAGGFARSCGVAVEALQRLETPKGEWLVYRVTDPGSPVGAVLPRCVADAAGALSIGKGMRWGTGEASFVRPVHWLVALHGETVVDMALFGVDAGAATFGHRFHHPQAIELAHATDYEARLREPGYVIAGFAQRRASIREQLQKAADVLGGQVRMDDALLDEVTGLVEWPVAITGAFEDRYLSLPDEVTISTLESHQRYFPVYDREGGLLPAFITIANIDSVSPETVRHGNERVIRPRLADALFFWKQDRQITLAQRARGLDRVLFQQALGSLADKTERIKQLTDAAAEQVGAEKTPARRAAALAKADLLTDMVGEFPDLQGVMGRHYALADGEPDEVAQALEEQYLPRHAGDRLPASATGQALALADGMDTLCGIFALGKKPTGEKDPFALRRTALGILRILIEGKIALDLQQFIRRGLALQPVRAAEGTASELMAFFLGRLRALYTSRGVNSEVFAAVAASETTRPLDFHHRLEAVNRFLEMAEATRLVAANKRIRNLLRKVGDCEATVSSDLLEQKEERALFDALIKLEAQNTRLVARGEYQRALVTQAGISRSLDEFFDAVLVMADNKALRDNRLGLLVRLSALCSSVADISLLPALAATGSSRAGT
jgi:glycyl-tRNA synthetase beta chain